MRAIRTDEKPVAWVFLDQDYIRCIRWSKGLGEDFKQIKISAQLQETANSLRKPFLDLITDLGRRHDSPAWWASRVSERNTLVSPLFLYCCYLKIALGLLKEVTGTLCVVSESWSLLGSIGAAAGLQCQVNGLGRSGRLRQKSLFCAKAGFRLLAFLGAGIRGRVACSRLGPMDGEGKRVVLIHTYIDESLLGEDEVFHDRYFPGLSEWLEHKGFSVITLPVLYNMKRSNRSVWRWLGKNRQIFLDPYAYHAWSDYFDAIREARREATMLGGSILLEGIDATGLFEEERQRTAFSSLHTLLYFSLPRRLVAAGIDISLVITVFENMVDEKLFILGFRRYIPSAYITAYQHSALWPLMLCLFVTAGEAEFAPLPDHVVSNGSFSREVLVREGLPRWKVVEGPALRYAYLWQKGEAEAVPEEEIVHVLVPLPQLIGDAQELLVKVTLAFEHSPDLKIRFKTHPMSSLEKVLSGLPVKDLPQHMQFVTGDMGKWVARAKVVVGLSSNAVLDALAAGRPLVAVGRENSLNLNPLGFFPGLDRIFCSPEEIREETIRLLHLSGEQSAEYRRQGDEVLGMCFNKVTDSLMETFIMKVDSAAEQAFDRRSATKTQKSDMRQHS
jgi:hypothetical protein